MYVYVIHMSLAVVRCFISPCGAQFWRCIDTILEPSKINVRNGIVCPFQNTQICLGGSQFLHPVGGSSRWLLVARPLWARVHLALWHPESVPLKLLEEWRCSTGSSALRLGIGWRNRNRETSKIQTANTYIERLKYPTSPEFQLQVPMISHDVFIHNQMQSTTITIVTALIIHQDSTA